MPYVWLNGNFLDESTASISLRDAGLLHAAGVFTTMRSYARSGCVFRIAQHLQRLRASCEALFVPLKYMDEQLAEVASELLRRNSLGDARLRLTVTRGIAQQDPLHGLTLDPNVFLTAAELQPHPAELYERGMTVMLLDEQKLNPYDIQAGHKTLNYFSRLAALREANRPGAGEALWFNVHNYLQSGSISNVFIVKSGKLITPPAPQEMHDPAVGPAMPYPRSAVLPGITRGCVIELARASGIDVTFASINVDELLNAEEIFLTNSVMEIMPVTRIERSDVGDAQPGEITRRLSELLEREIGG